MTRCAAAATATAANPNRNGCAVTEYRWFVRTKQMVDGTYRIGVTSSHTRNRFRLATTIPAMARVRYAIEPVVANA